MNIKTLIRQKKFQYPILLKLPETVDKMDNTDIINNFNLNRIKSRIPEYFSVCFNYALHNNDIQDLETAFKYTLYNYTPVHIQDATAGDIITFHRIEPDKRELRIPNERTIEHFAIISYIDIDKNILNIKSKFGQCGIFEGKIDELPVFYGNTFVIWRKKNKNSPTTKLQNVKKKIDSL